MLMASFSQQLAHKLRQHYGMISLYLNCNQSPLNKHIAELFFGANVGLYVL